MYWMIPDVTNLSYFTNIQKFNLIQKWQVLTTYILKTVAELPSTNSKYDRVHNHKSGK